MKLLLSIMGLTLAASGQQTDATATPAGQHSAMVERGDHAMGFSHEKTTHHFRLFQDGGAIDVQANDLADTISREEIRAHLSHIAKFFAEGRFNIPMFIHGTTPPGVSAMEKRHDLIHYQFQQTEDGARVRIRTADPNALAAVHEFLRFQIAEHHTGDRTDITNDTRGN